MRGFFYGPISSDESRHNPSKKLNMLRRETLRRSNQSNSSHLLRCLPQFLILLSHTKPTTVMKVLYLFLLPLFFSCSLNKEQPITDAEATAYAKSIDSAVAKGDKNIINKVLDEDLFADEVAKAAGQGSNRGLKDGVKTGLQKQNLSRQVFASLGEDGSYEFVKQYGKDGTQHIVFRLFGEGGLNYHDFTLAKYHDKIKAKDIYIFLSGENLSKTMGGIVTAMMDANDKAAISLKEQSQRLPQIRSLYQQKKFEEAKRLFDGLPPGLRKEKGFQLLNVQITSGMDKDAYTGAMNEFEKLYGDDPTVQLALFDNYFYRGEYDRLLKVLDGLDKAVQDPLLDYYRASVYTKKGDEAAAVRYLEALQKKKPDFGPGALELLAHYMNKNEIKKADDVVAAYKANANLPQSRLADVKALYPDAAEKMKW